MFQKMHFIGLEYAISIQTLSRRNRDIEIIKVSCFSLSVGHLTSE